MFVVTRVNLVMTTQGNACNSDTEYKLLNIFGFHPTNYFNKSQQRTPFL